MARTTSALCTRTPAERAAIDARADAWLRPLTLPQRLLLRAIAKQREYTGGFSRATFAALRRRGFAKRGKRGGTLCITAAGWRELARSRG